MRPPTLMAGEAPSVPADRPQGFVGRGEAGQAQAARAGDPAGTLRAAIAQLRRNGVDDVLGELLRDANDRQSLVETLGALLDVSVRRMQDLSQCEPRFDALPFADCARRHCAVVNETSGAGVSTLLLLVDPFDVDLIPWARAEYGPVTPCLVSSETFDAWLAHCEANLSAFGNTAAGYADARTEAEARPGADAEVINLRQIGADDSPAVRFVNSTIYDALKAGASDIHLECDPVGLNVKFRLDGVLTAVRRIESAELAAQAISRIKVMAQLDIAERRVPQDGRLQVVYSDRAIDVRVSIMPSIHGEDAVLRILDRRHLAETLAGLTLAKLGFDEDGAEALRRLCRKPHGMLLVTGPTGSGKTTTLYAAIAETHQSRDKIVTIEDPVEYQLPGVLQIPVNERKGLTFARGLRSILRHDPDKILVGEIRDAETAQIAVQSALTGHLVFTTVHANTVFDVVGRFQQFGIDAYTFASAINGVLAQRLVRRLCAGCAVSVGGGSVADSERHGRDLPGILEAGRRRRAVGCERCRGTGYAGRFAIGELLIMNPALRELVASREPIAQIQAEARKTGWRTLRELALEAVERGVTTAEEVDRVAA